MKTYDRVAIIGLGLIGGSIARALKERKLAQTIIGCDSNEVSLAFARKNNMVDFATVDAGHAVKDCQIVILATPISTLESITKTIAPHLAIDALVMDVGSVKMPAINAIAPHLPPHVEYIPAHPIAGSEQSGVSAGRADLFEKKRVVITPEAPLDERQMKAVNRFWQLLGARVDAMPPATHDVVYAYVSHLPQLLCYAAAQAIMPTSEEFASHQLLQKFLRLYFSNETLWADIFICNKEHVLNALERYLDVVYHMQRELQNAPIEEVPGTNVDLARLSLFPRVASSCLVTTVMEAEKNVGFALSRYAGAGFADFTSPVEVPPDADIEHISKQYPHVAAVLGRYQLILEQFHASIKEGDVEILKKLLKQPHNA